MPTQTIKEEDKELVEALRKKYDEAKNTAEKMKEAIEALGGSVYDDLYDIMNINLPTTITHSKFTIRPPYDNKATWRAKVLFALNALDGGTFHDIFNYLLSVDKTLHSNKDKSNNAVRSLLATLKKDQEIKAIEREGKLFYFPTEKGSK